MDPTPVYFEVPGPFGVKGSTFAFPDRRSGKIRTKTDSKYGRAFAVAVKVAARAARVPLIPKGTGVVVSAVYEFPRPTGKDRARRHPCVRPDADKLIRALLDALSGTAYADDGQVVSLSVRKTYGRSLVARVMVAPEDPATDPADDFDAWLERFAR